LSAAAPCPDFMAMIPNADLERLKRNTDLAALVRARGIALKKHGSRDLAGRCPFHEDDKPSFIVTPGKNLFHCFGCGAKGGPIDFVMKLDRLGFRGAVDVLLQGSPVQRAATLPEPEAAKRKAPLPEERAQVLLERVVAIYQKNFAEAPEGRAYLEKRGLGDLGLLQKHRAGYASGRLPEILPPGGPLRAELKSLGVLLADGSERFTGCVVFPVCDEDGRIVTLYGRYTGAGSKRHVYLPDRPAGLWNASVLQAAGQIILVESILDALSVETAGHAHVLSIQGTNGLNDDDAALFKSHGVQRVRLLLDADAAGRAATERLKAKLSLFSCETVALPEGEDPNSFLVQHGAASLGERLAAPGAAVAAKKEKAGEAPAPDGSFVLTFGLRRYEVRGLEKSVRGLKATVRVEKAGRLHVDTLDLNSARMRRQLALALVRLLEESADTIEADLVKLLTACETAAVRGSNDAAQNPGSGAEAPALSAQDKAEGESLGRDPQLLEIILADYERCGLVGERANKLLCYLAMTSRKLPRPLAVMNLASSGAGKTALQDAALAFCPPEDLIKLTSLSGKALFYKERNSLKNKVLALEEGDGVQEAMYALRNLISAGELVTESTIKDPASGRLVTMANKVEGPTAVFLTTTNPDLDPETKSRFFVTSVDESREQTEAILSFQRRRHTLAGLAERAQSEAILRRHRAFQRCLQPLAVINPYAEQLSYGDNRLPSRRDQPKYLGLIEAIAFLRQMQKPVKMLGGQPYLEVDVEDIRRANTLATELMGHSLDELSRPGHELLLVLDKMCRETNKVAQEKKPLAPFFFSRRSVREFAGWTNARVHRYLSELVELEYVVTERGGNGVLHRYTLAWDGSGQEGGRFLLGLRAPEELRPVAGPSVAASA